MGVAASDALLASLTGRCAAAEGGCALGGGAVASRQPCQAPDEGTDEAPADEEGKQQEQCRRVRSNAVSFDFGSFAKAAPVEVDSGRDMRRTPSLRRVGVGGCVEVCDMRACRSELKRREYVTMARRQRTLDANLLRRSAKEAVTMERRESRRSSLAFSNQFSTASAPDDARRAASERPAPEQLPDEDGDAKDPPTWGGPDTRMAAGSAKGDLKLVQRALKEGASLAPEGCRRTTPLMLASASSAPGAMEVAKALLEAQADVNGRDYHGWSALHFACRGGNRGIVSLLLGHKASLLLTADQKTALMLAAAGSHADIVEMLCAEVAVKQTIQEPDIHGQVALHHACRNGSEKIVKQVISSRGKVHTRDSEGRQPLHIASESGALKVVKYLIQRGSKINMPDSVNRTPLHFACSAGHETVSSWLVSQKANPDKKSLEGVTPFDLAVEKGLLRLVKEVARLHWDRDMSNRLAEEQPDD